MSRGDARAADEPAVQRGGTFAFGEQTATGTAGLAEWFRGTQPPERRGGAFTTEVAGWSRDALVRGGGRWRIERRDCVLLRPPR